MGPALERLPQPERARGQGVRGWRRRGDRRAEEAQLPLERAGLGRGLLQLARPAMKPRSVPFSVSAAIAWPGSSRTSHGPVIDARLKGAVLYYSIPMRDCGRALAEVQSFLSTQPPANRTRDRPTEKRAAR